MIAVDTSALVAILLDEPRKDDCITALSNDNDVLISAGTLAEASIIAACRGLSADLASLVEKMGFEVVAVTHDTTARIGQIYAKWGKGIHPASLNFGDCFAYDVAREHSCPLLFIGNDFSRTDIQSAI